jgi:Zn-dependent protease with chaperone function
MFSAVAIGTSMSEEQDPATLQSYPKARPDIALYYTLVELSLAAACLLGKDSAQRRLLCDSLTKRVEFPSHLRQELARVAERGILPDHLNYNPFFTPAQSYAVLLWLSFLSIKHTFLVPLTESWQNTYQISHEKKQYLLEQVPNLCVSIDADPLELIWNPPEIIEVLTNKMAYRLALGAHQAKPIRKISSHYYEHEWDRAALRRMKEITGFDQLLNWASKQHFERIQRILSKSQRIEVTPYQFPELYEIWLECLERAGIQEMPQLYVEMGGLNAFTTGIQDTQIVLSSTLVSLFDEKELMFVIGHELGHINSAHVKYSMLAMMLPSLAEAAGAVTLGLGGLVGKGLQLAVMDWYRKAEITCDRYGLLVCQSLEASQRALMKLAGAPPRFFSDLNWKAFVEQGRLSESDTAVANKVYQYFLLAYQSHPWPAVRAYQLQKWVDAGEYQRLLALAEEGAIAIHASICTGCGYHHGDGRFCEQCGLPISRS